MGGNEGIGRCEVETRLRKGFFFVPDGRWLGG